MTIWEKVSNIIKRINSELIYNKNISKSWKKDSTQKKVFNVFIYQ